jgi:hypothetical protein
MGAQGIATLDFGTPINPAVKTYFFHTDATLSGAPSAPAGNATLSEIVPDVVEASALAGGHLSTSTGVETSLLNKPAAKDETGVPGLPPLDPTPLAAHRFGWFSDLKLNGRFFSGNWRFQWREDDDTAGVVGNPIVNLFAASTRDFAGTMRLLAQLVGTTDWWAGAVNTNSWQSMPQSQFVLANEYLFVQVWCHETSGLLAGKTLTIHQEGSDLTNAQRTFLQTPLFGQEPVDTAFVDVPSQTGLTVASFAAGTQTAEAYWARRTTTDDGVDEHEEGASLCPLVCSVPVDGTLRITAHTLAMLGIGTFKIDWAWN